MNKLDTIAFQKTLEDWAHWAAQESFDPPSPESNPEPVDDDTALGVEKIITAYLTHLKAGTKDQTIARLTNANNALVTVVDTCGKAQALIQGLGEKPEHKEIRDAFVHYLQIIANQASVYLSGDPN